MSQPADAGDLSNGETGDNGDSQETAVFVPGASDREIEIGEPLPHSTVQPFSPAWSAENESTQLSTTSWTTPEPMHPTTVTAPSLRGFFLGLFATILIVAVFAAWSWSAILDQEARDSIRDFFSFFEVRGW